jgi:hypothetical protein
VRSLTEASSAAASPGSVSSMFDLVALQRDQRRDHERRPLDQDGGHLVDERLAGAGRHDREHVALGQYGGDRLALARPQRVEAKALAHEALDLVSVHGGSSPARPPIRCCAGR